MALKIILITTMLKVPNIFSLVPQSPKFSPPHPAISHRQDICKLSVSRLPQFKFQCFFFFKFPKQTICGLSQGTRTKVLVEIEPQLQLFHNYTLGKALSAHWPKITLNLNTARSKLPLINSTGTPESQIHTILLYE